MGPSSSPEHHLSLPLFLLTALYYLPNAFAYSWIFTNAPKQCSNLTISIAGSDGIPPYHALILPFGPSPLPNNIEARQVMDIKFPGDSRSVSFQLSYPENSQFVAVVSDSQSFGSGGTSVAALVASSNDASCFDVTQSLPPDFFFSLSPDQIVQCSDTRIWWDPSTAQGTPNFLGIIPGGQSFAIPENQITQDPSEGTGFTWTPSLRGATTLLLTGGDNRGNGTAGFWQTLVSPGINNNASCLTNSSPSSTPGSPAGGSYPTGTGWSSGSGKGSSSNVGSIVGGVIAGLAALVILILVLFRQQRKQKSTKQHSVDLLSTDGDDEGDERRNKGYDLNELPQYYQPEPFMVSTPELYASITNKDDPELGRPLGRGTPTSFYTRSTTPDPASASGSSGKKGSAPRPMWGVNIIQHDDGGPGPSSSAPEREGLETIELPPAYPNVMMAGS